MFIDLGAKIWLNAEIKMICIIQIYTTAKNQRYKWHGGTIFYRAFLNGHVPNSGVSLIHDILCWLSRKILLFRKPIEV